MTADAYLIVTAGGEVCERSGVSTLSAIGEPGKVCFILALGETVNELAAIVETLKPPLRGKSCTALRRIDKQAGSGE